MNSFIFRDFAHRLKIGAALVALIPLAHYPSSAQISTNAYDVATNYWNYSNNSGNFSGNQGFGFGSWILSTAGGGDYISNDAGSHPHSFGIWNSAANAASTAVRAFNTPLTAGATFSVELEISSLSNASNTNGFKLQGAGGTTLFSFYHLGGDSNNGWFNDANGTGVATNFTLSQNSFTSLTFTINNSTNYTFTDNTTGAGFSG